jgi:uncharacterized protein YndB with AHSA1/START domain
MDYGSAFGAEFREVRDRTRDGVPVRAVIATRLYTTERNDLWNALTDAERLPRWFLPVTGQLEIGGRYQLEGNAAGSILKCDPPEEFEITWEYGGNVSWLRVSLSSEADGTRMALEHLSPKDEAAEDHWKQYGPGATGVGWDLTLLGLALHLDRGGRALDQEADNAWMASDEGKEFMRASADHWRQAHVDAGEDSGVAEEMAKRTANFFTGA